MVPKIIGGGWTTVDEAGVEAFIANRWGVSCSEVVPFNCDIRVAGFALKLFLLLMEILDTLRHYPCVMLRTRWT